MYDSDSDAADQLRAEPMAAPSTSDSASASTASFRPNAASGQVVIYGLGSRTDPGTRVGKSRPVLYFSPVFGSVYHGPWPRRAHGA